MEKLDQAEKPESERQHLNDLMYVAVGFNVEVEHSLFYIKEFDIERFFRNVMVQVIKHRPDFVSIRIIK